MDESIDITHNWIRIENMDQWMKICNICGAISTSSYECNETCNDRIVRDIMEENLIYT